MEFQDTRTLSEAAQEAWMELKPNCYLVSLGNINGNLPMIASHVPNRSPGARAKDLGEFFVAGPGGEEPMFMRLLRAQNGMVHFLYFWKAFGEAVRLSQDFPDEGLISEVETVRDRLLRSLEESAKGKASGDAPVAIAKEVLPLQRLIDEVHRAASMSAIPRFWQEAATSLGAEREEVVELYIEELTTLLLCWLQDAPHWEHQIAGLDRQPSVVDRMPSVDTSSVDATASAGSKPAKRQGLPVYVHIYDVSQEESIQKINRILAHKRSPIKIGGVFHAGVEVNGLEWSFGFSNRETRPGVACGLPKSHEQHHYRQTVTMSSTYVPPEDIAEMVSALLEEYPGDDYDLLRRNCCHFADDFCRRLGVGGIPGWVHRLARLGAGLDAMLQAAPAGVRDRVYAPFAPE